MFGRIAAWVAHRLPFDRIYFYVLNGPCISASVRRKRTVITMLAGSSGRRVPQVRGRSGCAIVRITT